MLLTQCPFNRPAVSAYAPAERSVFYSGNGTPFFNAVANALVRHNSDAVVGSVKKRFGWRMRASPDSTVDSEVLDTERSAPFFKYFGLSVNRHVDIALFVSVLHKRVCPSNVTWGIIASMVRPSIYRMFRAWCKPNVVTESSRVFEPPFKQRNPDTTITRVVHVLRVIAPAFNFQPGVVFFRSRKTMSFSFINTHFKHLAGVNSANHYSTTC